MFSHLLALIPFRSSFRALECIERIYQRRLYDRERQEKPLSVGDREIVIKILIVFTEDIFVVLSTSFIELVAGLCCQDGDEEHVFLQEYL